MRKVFLCVLALLMLVLPVSATTSFISDEAALLTGEEASALDEKLIAYHTDYAISLAVVTTESLDGQTIEDYAKACYAEGGYDNDCALLVICDTEGLWYIYTSGLCATLIPDSQLSQLGAVITNDLQAGNYAQTFAYFAETFAEPVCEEINAQNAAAEQTQKNQKTYVFLGVLGGFLVGVVIAAALWFKARPAKSAGVVKSAAPVEPLESVEPVVVEPVEVTEPVVAAVPAEQPKPAKPAKPVKLPSFTKPAKPQRRVRPPLPSELAEAETNARKAKMENN